MITIGMVSITMILNDSLLSESSTNIPFHKNSKFHHPLQIQAGGLYNKINLQLNGDDRRKENEYRRTQNGTYEGEIKLIDSLSVSLSSGYSKQDKTDSGTFRGRERIRLGIKYAYESDNLLLAVGIFQFTRDLFREKTETNNPDFFILRPYFGMGYRINNFQIQTNFHFQSETNELFKERIHEEFRRHYQISLALSYSLLENLDVFFEFEKRFPYDSYVDIETRFANVYPGFLVHTKNHGSFGISAGFPVIHDRIFDRSLRLQYFYFW